MNGEIFDHPDYPQGGSRVPVTLRFLDADLSPDITFEDTAPWCSNYFIGNDSNEWHTDVQNYHTVRLNDIYSGIDITGTGNGRTIAFGLVVHPGADLSQLRFTNDFSRYIFFEGAPRPLGTLTIDENGDLVFSYVTCVF